MAFYVPLGPRGVILQVGTFLIGLMGGLVYRVAASRRGMDGPVASPLTMPLPD